ncbi:carbohydrate ABC transporter permease [Vallitalea guaymasensis]|uniref:Carbohydrate ABC transporter permease n=1 Tax=Vallitalea guaymasensis TaxID=1185412 RepID=A0A8J8MFU6_9FIRM|nr:carbohydrate ABC transporter permease [Vallitalea guaymasensis]
MRKEATWLKKFLRILVIILITLLALFPFYILSLLAFTPSSMNFSKELILLPQSYFENFGVAWEKAKMGRSIINSLIITLGSVAVIVSFASMAGYAIARVNNKFNRIIYYLILGCMMIPGIINTVPLYTLMIKIGGINTHWAMILVCAANALPFSVFLFTGFIRGLPINIEEAAIIDGCTKIGSFWRIVFPILKPVTSAVIIINGLNIWNNYAQAIFFLQKQSMRTIPLAISMFYQQYGAKWHLMAAAAMIGLAPAVVIFIIFQKYFIKGITAGSVKG